MKTVNSRILLSTGAAITLAVTAWLPAAVTAADEPMKPMKGGEHQMMVNTQPGADVQPAGSKMMMDSKMMEHCTAMMEQKAKIMATMKAQDADLTAQVAKMNNAPENKKVELMSAIVIQMVEQRTTMHAQMEKSQEGMMDHMMQHMQMGKESMSQCPMMKGMDKK